MRVTPIFFICWKIFTMAWLSFWAVLKTQGATGFTIASAAAQERRSVLASSAMGFTAMVSPLVGGPMMAKTCSSSMSCFAKEIAFSGLAAGVLHDELQLAPGDAALLRSGRRRASRACAPPARRGRRRGR